jgi:hypothetical protein
MYDWPLEDNSTLLNTHPYYIDYLQALVSKESSYAGFELAQLAYKVGEWLEENCTDYTYSYTYAPISVSNYGYTILDIEIHTPQTTTLAREQFINVFSQSVDIATAVFFKHEQDLLAFRLRWGL